jgi:hypothetical protein
MSRLLLKNVRVYLIFVGESLAGNQKALSPFSFFRYFTPLYPKCQEFFSLKIEVFHKSAGQNQI